MSKRWYWLIMIAAIAGVVLSAVSLQHYLHVQKNGVMQESFCTINQTVNCDLVAISSYSRVGSWSVAGLSLVYNVILVLMSAGALLSANARRSIGAYLFWMTLGSVVVSGYMGYISLVKLGMVCLMCVGLYATNAILFVGAWGATGAGVKMGAFAMNYWKAVFTRKDGALGFSPRFIRHTLTVGVMGFIGVAILANATEGTGLSQDELKMVKSTFYSGSEYVMPIEEGDAVWGNPNAPVTIVEFSDFQCPFCQIAAFSIKPYLAEFKDQVRFVFLHMPLDQACNPNIEHPMHTQACLTARASICADEQQQFWAFHDEAFRGQKLLSPDFIQSTVAKMGLDKGAFETCMASPKVDEKIGRDLKRAAAAGITGTPTVFINNRKMRFWRSPEALQLIVREEIQRSREKTKK